MKTQRLAWVAGLPLIVLGLLLLFGYRPLVTWQFGRAVRRSPSYGSQMTYTFDPQQIVNSGAPGDILVFMPGVGEIIGGSQREERLDILEARMREQGLDPAGYWWYLDLRKYGTVPHSGFGLGLERMVQFVTGMTNIRDVIPFPRTPGSAEF